jgi:hypothetical protein
MNRLQFLLVLAFLALAQPLYSQLYLGVEGGWNKNHLSTSNNSQYFTENVDKSGFSAGIPVRYRVLDWLAFEADPGYIQKNYMSQRTGFFNGIYQKSSNAYWQLPVMAQFSFGGQQLRGYMSLGVYVAYWASGRIKGTTTGPLNSVDTAYANTNPIGITGETNPYNYNQPYSFNSTRDNRIEFGGIGAIGVSYEMEQGYLLFVEGRYTRSLTDMQKKYELNQTPRYNDNFGINVGVMVRMNRFFGGGKSDGPFSK